MAHWKSVATALFCAAVRSASGTASALSVASGISLPLSAAGQEYSLAERCKRKRPMVARRTGESWRRRTVRTVSAVVARGAANLSARKALATSL